MSAEALAVEGAVRAIKMHHELAEHGLAGIDAHDLAMAVLVLEHVGVATAVLETGRADLAELVGP